MSSDRKSKSTVPVHRTIRCHLDASEDILRQVWEEMTQKNTPLIVQLLKSVSEQPEFEAHKEKGEITSKEIIKLRKFLTKDSELEEQSGRLRSSAESFVKEVYSSWLTLYQKRKRQKEGKEYFLENILKSDVELVGESNCDLQTIRSKAQEVLTQPEKFLKQLTINNEDVKASKSARKRVNKNIYNKSTDAEQREDSSSPNNVDENKLEILTNVLYKIHKQTHDILTRCAVAYLIKNHNKISEVEEDVQKLKKRRSEKKVEIKRLGNQIKDNRLPSGRDITGERYSEAFNNLMNQVPKDNKEWEDWIANLSRKISHLPYPIDYLYGDLTWYKNDGGNIFVYFNGWSEYHFKICCNKRQRHFFERFLEDHKAFKGSEKSKEKLSGSLITLRSAQLLWQQGEGKGEAWKVHKLALHCTYDARLWTAEGTEEVRKEKTDKAQKRVSKAEENKKTDKAQKRVSKAEENKKLEKNQQIQLNKDKSSLSRLNNSFNRPSKIAYRDQSNIIVGVSFHPVELATVTI